MYIVLLPPREAGSVRPQKREGFILIRHSAKVSLPITAHIKPLMPVRPTSYLLLARLHRALLPRFNMLKFSLIIQFYRVSNNKVRRRKFVRVSL